MLVGLFCFLPHTCFALCTPASPSGFPWYPGPDPFPYTPSSTLAFPTHALCPPWLPRCPSYSPTLLTALFLAHPASISTPFRTPPFHPPPPFRTPPFHPPPFRGRNNLRMGTQDTNDVNNSNFATIYIVFRKENYPTQRPASKMT